MKKTLTKIISLISIMTMACALCIVPVSADEVQVTTQIEESSEYIEDDSLVSLDDEAADALTGVESADADAAETDEDLTNIMLDDEVTETEEPANASTGGEVDETDAADETMGVETKAADEKASEDAEETTENVEVTEEKSEKESTTEETTAKDKETSADITTLGATISGTFDSISGMDVATVRYYTDSAKTTYAFADFSYDEGTGKYSYSFTAPYEGFAKKEGTETKTQAAPADATVVAYYYSTLVWDGAVDVTWYNETDTDFDLYNPAQLAGFAAIVNGSCDATINLYEIKGYRSHPSDLSYNRGFPDVVQSTYYESTDLPAGVKDEAYKGVMQHDFANRTVHIMADMNMGGVDGSEVYMGEYDISADDPTSNWNRNLHDGNHEGYYYYPNWTPIGGEYLMDVSDGSTMIVAFFNGTIEGNGHNINNLYCYRWSYRTVGDTAFGYCQGVGFVGVMGALYDDDRGTESTPSVMPAIRDLGISGFVYGRRMVGGFVGCIGGGANAAAGTSIPGGIALENLANHTYAYCTDSKGLGGIVGCSMAAGSIVNCYNTGYIKANYAAPSGGIIGSNESMDVFCCYNTGTITAFSQRGRGIGGDNSGSNYTVDSCYYLEECGNDPTYPGYYAYNLAPSVSVNTTSLTRTQMTNGTLLSYLNVNGTAFVAGSDGYPALYWESGAGGTGNLTIIKPNGGTVTGTTGSVNNGKVIYLSNEAETGWNFRYYTLDGNEMTGDYVTVNGDTNVSAFYESSKAGVLKIADNKVCNITITKNGTIIEDGVPTSVTDYPVHSGDSIYEGDFLMIQASIKTGQVPDNPDLVYCDTVGISNPYEYGFTYTGGTEAVRYAQTFTVGPEINGDDVSLTLDVRPRTTQKLWRFSDVADTTWYDESQTTFTLTTAAQLAGIASLVQSGTTFEGKTIKLGNDISLANTDGTTGKRFWDGIGTSDHPFAGIFDGDGHKITDMHSNKYALFAFCYGASANSRAVIKNLSIYGDATGQSACGVVYDAYNADIENVNSYVAVNSSASYAAGIIGHGGNFATGETVAVKNCNNYGSVSGEVRVAGIVGELEKNSTVTNCVNKGDIYAENINNNAVGGVAGSLKGTVTKCANYGNILAYSRSIGGVVGQSVAATAEISDCYNAGNITFKVGTADYDCIGGIVGYGSYYKIKNSFNYGNIQVVGVTNNNVGGIIGRDMNRSSNTTSNVYMLNTSCNYVDASRTLDQLTDPETGTRYLFATGMNIANATDFASNTGVLPNINVNSNFVLTNGKYPEFSSIAGLHVHSGGTATCCKKAVCEVCGLEYGDVDSENHVDTIRKNVKEAVWTTDGYTGDICCNDCGSVIEKGSVIKADTSKNAVTFNIFSGTETINTKTFTIAEFDALKTTSPAIGYSYGTKSTEIMAATVYVTLDDVLDEFNQTLSNVDKIIVRCAGTADEVSGETLRTCNKYYENDVEYSAPAAFAINWSVLSGTLEEVAAEAKPSESLRFGYGISKEQYDEGASLGGRRLVSPVKSVDVYVSTSGAVVSGTITGYTGTGDVTVTLTPEGTTTASYTCTGKNSYEISNVATGNYTLSVRAEKPYVQHDYTVQVTAGGLTQNVTIYQLGDINMDGKVRGSDVITLSRHLSGIQTITDAYVLKLADTNKDGKIRGSDTIHLSEFIAGIIPEL